MSVAAGNGSVRAHAWGVAGIRMTDQPHHLARGPDFVRDWQFIYTLLASNPSGERPTVAFERLRDHIDSLPTVQACGCV